MMDVSFTFKNHIIQIYGEKEASFFFFFNEEIKLSPDLKEFQKGKNILYINILTNDWFKDFSIYKHPKIYKNGDDFVGGGDEYLSFLLNDLIPFLKKEFKLCLSNNVIVGYSLAGLFSLYASTKTDMFNGVISVSGSLWYNGFTDYLKENKSKSKNVYLSIGDKESNSKNSYLKKGYESQLKCLNILKEQNIKTFFNLEEGNHFSNKDERILNGLKYFLKLI